MLAVDALHAAVRQHRGRVREIAAGLGKPDDRRRLAGACGELVERLGRRGDERGPQQQVFGRIAGDGQLGEHDEIGANRRGRLVHVVDPLGVAFEIADDGVHLRGRDPHPRHR